MKTIPLAFALALAGAAPWAGAQTFNAAQNPALANPLSRQFATPAQVAAAAAPAPAPVSNAAAALAAAGLAPAQPAAAQPAAAQPAVAQPAAAQPAAAQPAAAQPAAAQPAAAEVAPKPRFVPDTDYNRGSQQYYEARDASARAKAAAAYASASGIQPSISRSEPDLEGARALISELRARGVDESKINLELHRKSPAQFRRWAAEVVR